MARIPFIFFLCCGLLYCKLGRKAPRIIIFNQFAVSLTLNWDHLILYPYLVGEQYKMSYYLSKACIIKAFCPYEHSSKKFCIIIHFSIGLLWFWNCLIIQYFFLSKPGVCSIVILHYSVLQFVLTRIKYGPARYWAILFVFWFLVFGIWASRTHGAHAT